MATQRLASVTQQTAERRSDTTAEHAPKALAAQLQYYEAPPHDRSCAVQWGPPYGHVRIGRKPNCRTVGFAVQARTVAAPPPIIGGWNREGGANRSTVGFAGPVRRGAVRWGPLYGHVRIGPRTQLSNSWVRRRALSVRRLAPPPIIGGQDRRGGHPTQGGPPDQRFSLRNP